MKRESNQPNPHTMSRRRRGDVRPPTTAPALDDRDVHAADDIEHSEGADDARDDSHSDAPKATTPTQTKKAKLYRRIPQRCLHLFAGKQRAGDVADLVRVARVRLDERRLVGIPQAERAVAPARQQVRAGAREPHAQHGALVRDQARVLLGGVRGRRRHRGSESPRAPRAARVSLEAVPVDE